MRVGIVYTSTTPELIETVNTELKKQLGEDVEFLNYEDPSILAEVRDAGFVPAESWFEEIEKYETEVLVKRA